MISRSTPASSDIRIEKKALKEHYRFLKFLLHCRYHRSSLQCLPNRTYRPIPSLNRPIELAKKTSNGKDSKTRPFSIERGSIVDSRPSKWRYLNSGSFRNEFLDYLVSRANRRKRILLRMIICLQIKVWKIIISIVYDQWCDS